MSINFRNISTTPRITLDKNKKIEIMNEEAMRALHKDDRMQGRMPEMAIIENNTLAMMGLKQLLETVMPMMNI